MQFANATTIDHQQDNGFETSLNAYELAAAAVGCGVVVSAVGITTAVAPGLVLPTGALGGGLAYAGYCKRNNVSLNPFQGDKAEATPTPAAVASSKPAAVVDRDGKELEIENL